MEVDKMGIRNWDDIMREKYGDKTEARIAQLAKQVRDEVLGITLAELRKQLGMTQKEVASRMHGNGMRQSDISKLERGSDHLISTLKKYVEALGGELQVNAVFGDKTIRLRGV